MIFLFPIISFFTIQNTPALYTCYSNANLELKIMYMKKESNEANFFDLKKKLKKTTLIRGLVYLIIR